MTLHGRTCTLMLVPTWRTSQAHLLHVLGREPPLTVAYLTLPVSPFSYTDHWKSKYIKLVWYHKIKWNIVDEIHEKMFVLNLYWKHQSFSPELYLSIFFQQTDNNNIFLKKSMHTYRKIFSNYAYFSAKLFTHSWKGLAFYHKQMHLHLITIEKFALLILMAYGNSG